MAAYRRRDACLLLSSLIFVDIALCQNGAFGYNKVFDDRFGRGRGDGGIRQPNFFGNMGGLDRVGAGAGGDGTGAGNNRFATNLRPVLGTFNENPQPGGGHFAAHAVNIQGGGFRNPVVGMNVNQGPGMNNPAGFNNNPDPNPNMNIHNPDSHNAANGLSKAVDGTSENQPSKTKISRSVECGEDIQKFCRKDVEDNIFAILDCLQSDERTYKNVSPGCQHFLWQYKHDLIKDDHFDSAFNEMCASELSKIQECRNLPHGQGLIIPCLFENLENITTQSCQKFLNKMAGIIFSDYRYIYHFFESCSKDIVSLQCGRLHPEDDDSPHSQGRTVACLAEHLNRLVPECKKQVLRVYELQSNDYHMDRPLFYACHDDREKLCEEVKAGNGAVFQCLFDHLGKPDLSPECREKLELRQRLMNEDVRVEHTFYSKCLKDIEKHECLGGSTGHENTKRAHVLLCLENARMSGDESKVDPFCVQEMIKVRQLLLEDYRVNPDLLVLCSEEIEQECKGLEPGGNTMHCLMGLARTRARIQGPRKQVISDQCRAELQRMLKEINIAEDYRLDKPLQIACGDVVTAVCSHIRPGGGAIINCLMDNLDKDEMTDVCEDRLLEIQFFVARDFSLDPDLFKSCKRDAKKYCAETGNWADLDRADPDQRPRTLDCLRRHYYHHGKAEYIPQLSRACIFAVQRVMRRRAQRVDLHPEIEEACLTDLGDKCSEDKEDVEKGVELECLQVNYEVLYKECKKAIGRFTEEESEDIQMDAILMKSCTPMIKKFCDEELDNDADDVLECLIEHKNHAEMVPKCAAGIEHHQLISLKDFKFNRRFKEACQKSAQTLCQHMTTKYDVVSCLSEHVCNDTLLDKKQRVDLACRKQLKVELLQRGESIRLDPELKEKCSDDVEQLCANVSPGNAAVLECLKKHEDDLSKKCHKLLFKREVAEFAIADYTLLHTCKKMIRHYCDTAATEPEILNCLKKAKDDDEFDEKCRRIIIQRQITQSRDYRLNPLLQKSCRQDIPKFCSDVIAKANNDAKLEGKVISCLKQQFAIKRLSAGCEQQIRDRIKAASTDIRMAPVLLKACRSEIPKLCREDMMEAGDGVENMYIFDAGHGKIIECLKSKLSERKIENSECHSEVVNLLVESHVDVNMDPLLHTACQQDLLSLCRQFNPGQGRQMSCLLSFLDEDPRAMTGHCREMLRKRKEMWEYAAQVAPPESFGEIYDSVMSPPSKNYFAVVPVVLFMVIFIVGIFCGRVTKRLRAEVNDK